MTGEAANLWHGTCGPAPVPDPQDRFQGRRVLVVEDDPFVAMDLEAMLADLGCTVIGPAADSDGALALVRSSGCDFALVDANLGGMPADAVAAELAGRGVPFAFASGYGRDGLPKDFRQAPLLEKPYCERDVRAILDRLLSSGSARVLAGPGAGTAP